MDPAKNENLYKVYLGTFEYLKKNASKKDKYYKELKESYAILKELSPLEFGVTDNIKKFSNVVIYALDTNSLKIIEKALLTIDNIISHELVNPQIIQDMLKNMLANLYGKSMLNDDNINYKILNLCIILYSSKLVSINGVNLINIIKVCLNIFLSSKNPNCQNMAKLTLIQIVDNMIEKLEYVFGLYYTQNRGVAINKSLSNRILQRSFTPKYGILTSATVNFNNLPVFNTDDNCNYAQSANKESFRNTEMMEDYNGLFPKFFTYYLDLIEIDNIVSKNTTNNNNEPFINSVSNILATNVNDNEVNKKMTTLFESIKLDNFDFKNENDIKIGKFGWCINCRNKSNIFSEKINFPVCSNDCEAEVINFDKLIDVDINLDSTNCRDDYINTLKILSKLSIKEPRQHNYIEQINLKLREFCLELIQTLVQKGARYFLTDTKLIQVIRESTIDSLIKNTLSNEMNIFKLSVNLFLTIISNFRENLKDEIEIFINKVLVAILESENLGYVYKEIILDSLMKLAENCNFLVEIYINYDCDINHKSIFYDLINLMTKIIQGLYKKPKYANTFKPLQEANLRIKCLDFLTIFIRNLSQLVDENNKLYSNNINPNITTKNNTMMSVQRTNYNIPNPNEMTQNEICVIDEDLNASLFTYETTLTDHKDKISQNLKMKEILAKAIVKFNINPNSAFNFLKSNDWLLTENSFNILKEKLINSYANTPNFNKTPKTDENMIEIDSDVKSNSSQENKDLPSNSNPATSNFLYKNSYLMSNMDITQLQTLTYDEFYPREIVRFLKSNLKEINKITLGEFVCGHKPLNQKVLTVFIESYNFKNFHILEAMRILFSDFNIVGEGNIVDRVVQIFGQKYHKDNPTEFQTPDIAYYIAFSIMMLNTDLHREEIDNKMTLNKFINNVYLLCNRDEIDENYLIDMYSRVQNNPLIIPGQKLNLHNKNKKDLIKMEKESILKSTFEELQNKNLISNNYITVIDNDHIHHLIEASWSNFLGIFSQLLADFDEESIVNTCIDNILLIARICGVLRLETITEAFVNTILNMTNIMEGREIKQKNIECSKALVDFAVHSGCYIRTCWFNILNIISKIDYYHTIGGQFKDEAENFAKEIRRRSRKNPDKEIEIEFRNTEIICKNISIIFCDNIFSKSISFDEEGIVNFVSSLCKVSKYELELFFNPRNYSLHKLVEVADFNIFRIQIEWAKIWKLISDHLVYVATTYNHDNICIDAIDSLRQIIIKLLKKSDLTVYNFQIDFFRPFEIIFNQSVNRQDRSELILACIDFIVQNSKSIHSGWIIIFKILKQGLNRKDSKLNMEIVKIIQRISEDASIVNNINQDVFRGYIECLCRMYLEENFKRLAFDTILKLMSKIFSNLSNASSNNQIDKKFEFLKIFFYGFDDLLRINIIEHLNLLFEVISYNKEEIFSSDINSFIYVFYCYFKPHIVTLLLNYFDYQVNNFDIGNNCKIDNHKIANLEILKKFNSKKTTEDVYHNTKVYLEESLIILVDILEKNMENVEDNFIPENINSFNPNIILNNNFFEISKNGGTESKKLITNFLKNIIKCYDKDSDLILKKLEILKNFHKENYELALEFFLEKFWTMINRISNSYMNYIYFYEDLLNTLLNLCIFNQHSEAIFKVLSKNILSSGKTFSLRMWYMMSCQILFILNTFASIKTNIQEINLKTMLNFLCPFSNFYKDLVLNFNKNISEFKNFLLLDEYKLLNTIFLKILSIDIENEFQDYTLVTSKATLELLQNLSKIKAIILEKSPEEELSKYYDNLNILSLDYMNKIFKKYKLTDEEKNELIDIIVFEVQHIIPKFLLYANVEDLEIIFNNLMDLIDSNNYQLRKASKFLINEFVVNKLIKFSSQK